VIYDFFAHYVSVPLATPVLLTIGGLIVGGACVWMVAPSRKQLRTLEVELEHTRSEHRVYQVQVTEHFQKTSDLIANMTSSYKAVYDHLAFGAQELCDGPPALESDKFGVPFLIAEERRGDESVS